MSKTFPRRPTAPVHIDCRSHDVAGTLAEIERAATALFGRRLTVAVTTRAPEFERALQRWATLNDAWVVAHSCREGEHYAIVVVGMAAETTFEPAGSQTAAERALSDAVPTRAIGVPERVKRAVENERAHWTPQRPSPQPMTSGQRVAFRVQGVFMVDADPAVDHTETVEVDEDAIEAALEASESEKVTELSTWLNVRKAS